MRATGRPASCREGGCGGTTLSGGQGSRRRLTHGPRGYGGTSLQQAHSGVLLESGNMVRSMITG